MIYILTLIAFILFITTLFIYTVKRNSINWSILTLLMALIGLSCLSLDIGGIENLYGVIARALFLFIFITAIIRSFEEYTEENQYKVHVKILFIAYLIIEFEAYITNNNTLSVFKYLVKLIGG